MPETLIPQPKSDALARPAASDWPPAYQRLWQYLLTGAVLVLVLSLWLSPVHRADWRGLEFLIALAVVCNLLPIQLPGSGVHIFPLLPVIFAAAGLFGATAAVLTAATGITFFGLLKLRHARRRRFHMLAQLIASPVVTDGSCALLYLLLQALFFRGRGIGQGETPHWSAWLALSACTLLAFMTNQVLTTTQASLYYHQRWEIVWHNNIRWMLPSGVLLSPVAFVMGVLYHEFTWHGIGWVGILFIIVPTWAAHMAVVYHERTMAAYKQGVELLGRIMQESHPYTHGHLSRVAHWAKKIAEELKLSPDSMQFIEDAAILHDIGKVAVDDRVLNKVGKLSDDDWAMIRRHPVVGAEIVGHIRYFNKAAHWIRHHHERPDGGGYPAKMPGADIPVESGIISVVDAYDAMVGGPAKEDQRPYRSPMSPEAAVAELRRHAGTQFNAQVVEAFIQILEREQALEARGEQPVLAEEYDSLWDAPLATAVATGIPATAGGRT